MLQKGLGLDADIVHYNKLSSRLNIIMKLNFILRHVLSQKTKGSFNFSMSKREK